ACLQCLAWPRQISVAVNLSGVQLRRRGFARAVVKVLAETRLAPSRLELELTESVSLFSSATARRNLARLKAAGIRIALDDIGTGYSSLRCLTSFAFDKRKIDRSFVQRMGTRECDASVVRALVRIGSANGIETTAEGVEDERQLATLIGMG